MLRLIAPFCLVLFLIATTQNCLTTRWHHGTDPRLMGWVERDSVPTKFRDRVSRRMKDFEWRLDLIPEKVAAIKEAPDTPATRERLAKLLPKESTPPYVKWITLQTLAGYELKQKNYAAAAQVWKENIAHLPPERHDSAREIIALIEKNETKSVIRPLKGSINSPGMDYFPIPEPDGRRIFLTRRPHRRSSNDDIMVADRSEQGDWSARKIDSLNTPNSESPGGVSADGTTMTLFGNYSGGPGGGDIFTSSLTADGWSAPQALPAPINTRHFEADGFYSADGKAFLFASDRPEQNLYPFFPIHHYYATERHGNTEIFVSLLQADGSPGPPINLGPDINTPGSERMPYLHPDGRTLYFGSSGHNGLGDLDIYKSVRQGSGWQSWSKPVNIGKLINGSGTELGFRLTAAADRGFFSAQLGKSNDPGNIYEVLPLPENAVPATVVVALRGRVQDSARAPLEAAVRWHKTGQQQNELGRLKSKPDSGKFFITMNAGGEHKIQFFKQGYLPFETTIDFGDARDYAEKELIVTLRKASEQLPATSATPPAKVVERNLLEIPTIVNFGFNSARLTPQQKSNLDQVADILKKNPAVKVEIQGHTDTIGSARYNYPLSRRRATSVRDYLSRRGVSKERMRIKALGETKPLASNKSLKGRRQNRRVMFIVVR